MGTAHIIESHEDQDISEYFGDTAKAAIQSGGYHGSYHVEIDDGGDNGNPRIISTSGLGEYPGRGLNFSFFVRDNSWDPAVYFGWEDSNNWYRVAANDTWGRIQLDIMDGGSYNGNVVSIGSDVGTGWQEFVIDFQDPTITVTAFDSDGTKLGSMSHDHTGNNGTGIGMQAIGRDSAAIPQADFDLVRSNDPPNAPGGLSVTGHDNNSISLSWNSTKFTDNYTVYRAQSSGTSTADYSAVHTVSGTSYTDSGLEDGERYYYRVTANNDNGESGVSGEVNQITDLRAATIDSVDTSTDREISISWSKNDDSSDGEWEIYRSTDGTVGTQIADALALSTTSYTDTDLDDGERYYYTVRRVTDHASADVQDSGVTNLPAPSGLSVTDVTGDQVTVEWTDNANNGQYRVYVSRDLGQTWTIDGDNLSGTTTSYQTTALLDGEQYRFAVEVFTEHSSSDHTPGLRGL